MTVTINGSGAIVGSDRAESGVNDDITSLAAVSSVNGGQLAGMRNKIINGKMDVSQRGTSFAPLAGGAYSLDRWVYGAVSSAVATVTQQADAPSNNEFQYSYRYTVTTADTSIAAGDLCSLVQFVEGYGARDLIGRPFTLSFWVRSSKTGIHCVSFGNSINDRTRVVEYTISAANTWEQKSITVSGGLITEGTWNWTNGIGLQVRFNLMMGTTHQGVAGSWLTGDFRSTANQVNCLDTVGNIFAITGVQLEVGTVATPFEHRPIGVEFSLCQRYYETGKLFACCDGAMAYVAASTAFQTQKRTTPTFIVRDNAGNPGFCSVDATNLVPASVGGNETYVFTRVNNSVRSLNNFANFTWEASAEL